MKVIRHIIGNKQFVEERMFVMCMFIYKRFNVSRFDRPADSQHARDGEHPHSCLSRSNHHAAARLRGSHVIVAFVATFCSKPLRMILNLVFFKEGFESRGEDWVGIGDGNTSAYFHPSTIYFYIV